MTGHRHARPHDMRRRVGRRDASEIDRAAGLRSHGLRRLRSRARVVCVWSGRRGCVSWRIGMEMELDCTSFPGRRWRSQASKARANLRSARGARAGNERSGGERTKGTKAKHDDVHTAERHQQTHDECARPAPFFSQLRTPLSQEKQHRHVIKQGDIATRDLPVSTCNYMTYCKTNEIESKGIDSHGA